MIIRQLTQLEEQDRINGLEKEEWKLNSQYNLDKGFVIGFGCFDKDIQVGRLYTSISHDARFSKIDNEQLFLADDNTQYLLSAWIDEKYRGQHCFTKLLCYVEQVLKEQYGCKSVFLGVEANNVKAKEIYYHLGYIKEINRVVDSNNEVIIYLEKNLE